MQNHGSMFYLCFKFTDLICSHIFNIAAVECVLVHSINLLFYIPYINVANFWSRVVVNFIVKLKVYLYMHWSNIFFGFVVSAYNTKYKKEKALRL